MLQFLQPIWLWAASGILVPVLIHLWKVKEGKVLKIGSISLLSASTEKSARRIELNELLLLLLRCLIIILVSFFLSGPQWLIRKNHIEEKGWVLVHPRQTDAAYQQYGGLMDSLESAGFVFKRWDTSLAPLKKEQAILSKPEAEDRPLLSTWNIIDVLNRKAETSVPVYLFSPGSINEFSGKRPSSHLPIKIYQYDAESSATSAILHAHLVNNDSVMLSIGTSLSTGNTVQNVTGPLENMQDDSILISRRDNQLIAALNGSNAVEIFSYGYSVTIVADKNNADANAMASALKAISVFAHYNFKIEIKNSSDSIAPNQDWIFWLSEQPMPADLEAGHIFEYVDGKTLSFTSTFIIDNKNSIGSIPLYKRIEYPDQTVAPENVVWRDGFGDPLLVTKNDNVDHYLFFTRFNAEWNGLIWYPVFPAVMFDLVVGNQYKKFPAQLDQRQLNADQSAPHKISASGALKSNAGIISLSVYNWWILLLLFVVERIISTRKKPVHSA